MKKNVSTAFELLQAVASRIEAGEDVMIIRDRAHPTVEFWCAEGIRLNPRS